MVQTLCCLPAGNQYTGLQIVGSTLVTALSLWLGFVGNPSSLLSRSCSHCNSTCKCLRKCQLSALYSLPLSWGISTWRLMEEKIFVGEQRHHRIFLARAHDQIIQLIGLWLMNHITWFQHACHFFFLLAWEYSPNPKMLLFWCPSCWFP